MGDKSLKHQSRKSECVSIASFQTPPHASFRSKEKERRKSNRQRYRTSTEQEKTTPRSREHKQEVQDISGRYQSS